MTKISNNLIAINGLGLKSKTENPEKKEGTRSVSNLAEIRTAPKIKYKKLATEKDQNKSNNSIANVKWVKRNLKLNKLWKLNAGEVLYFIMITSLGFSIFAINPFSH